MERLLPITHEVLPRDDQGNIVVMAVDAQSIIATLALSRLVTDGDLTAGRVTRVVGDVEKGLRVSGSVCLNIAVRHDIRGDLIDGQGAVSSGADVVLRSIGQAGQPGFADRVWRKIKRIVNG